MQSSWPVLVAPEVLAVSPAATKSLRWIAGEAQIDVRAASVESGRGVELDGPVSLVDRVLRARVSEKRAELRACEASCGGGQE
jgi:hypothetical protein